MIHVVIPAAGHGSRFVTAGYGPKIHADVNGVPMLRAVVDNIRPRRSTHRITVVTTMVPPTLGDGVEILQLAKATSGAVETILAAGVVPGEPLLVANCDQLLGFDVTDLVVNAHADGCIATFEASRDVHSYVRLDGFGNVEEIAEKQVISDRAVAGVYFFLDGGTFAAAARAVLDQDRRVLGEFYVSTVIAEMVARGAQINTVHGSVATLGTPEELDAYLGRVRA